MQTAHSEDFGGEVELLAPVSDYESPEKTLRPLVHLGGDFFGDAKEEWVFGNCEQEVALVVQRHCIDLSEGVLAIEHPAVGARKERVGDVAESTFVFALGLEAGPVP